MNNNKYWILVADSSKAKLFTTEQINSDWKLVKEYKHPEGRERDSEIVSDKSGRFSNVATSGSSSFAEPTDPHEHEAENFARELAKELNLGRSKNLYHKLILVAPPHFHGMLNSHCNSHVLSLITHRLEKNYTQLKEHELIPRVREQINI